MNPYNPFQYPPDFQLARIHKQASKPGKLIKKDEKCPCCQTNYRGEIKKWHSRSIDHDFKNYGGAVVTYFWLVKLYAFVCLLVLLVYSSYLIASTHRLCPMTSEQEGQLKCQRFLGIFIVTNQILMEIIDKFNQFQTKTRILTLRTMTFVILIIGNLMALYTAGRFKRRYPQPKDISTFSLIFKNTKKNLQQFTAQLKQKFPQIKFHEILRIKTMQPFYTDYKNKLQTYYQCRIEDNQKKRQKLMSVLQKIDKNCDKQQQQFMKDSDRIIVVFQREVDKRAVKEEYELKGLELVKFMLGFGGRQKQFCENCPTNSEIIWNNIGSDQSQKLKLKVLSVVYFFLLIFGSYLFLFFCMHLVYDRAVLPSPWNVIIANIVMTIMVPIALTFRQLMNKLSQMRRPNTQTSRTMFIVLTTVLFHFIYYILIPTFYLYFSKKVQKNRVLTIVTNQTFNFLLVQFILAYIDFIFCQWNKRLKKVQNEEKPIGCQKILHSYIEYPRFPIQFKLIIMFKTYSFIILFAFESPFLVFLCFGLMVFLYFCDKFAVYRHYRMEKIDNKVQYRFLKIYSIFFSVYTLLIYSLTQKFDDLTLQFYAAFIFTIIAILIQIFVLKDRIFEDETILPSSIQEQNIQDSYKQKFDKFKQNLTNDHLDQQIKQYLIKEGYGSLQTQEQLGKEKLLYSN